MPYDYSEAQLIQYSTTRTRDRLLSKLMSGEMDIVS